MDDAVLKRVMPYSREAEESVVGSMMIDKEAIVAAAEVLVGEDFYQQQYGVLFETMVEMHNAGQPVDPVTLQARLKEKDVPKEITDVSFVAQIMTSVPTSANVKYYANIVKEQSVKRKLIHTLEGIASDCYSGKETLETIMDKTEKDVFQIVNSRQTSDFVPIDRVVLNALEQIENASKTKGNVTGIATGFVDLDYMTAGLHPSNFVLIAARPAMGKTAFVLNIAQHIAFKDNLCAAIFSLEMKKEELVNRLFSLESNVEAQKLRTGDLSDSDWERLVESAGIVGRSNLIIDDSSTTISEIRSKCRKFKLEHDLKVVIIDYLQLMSGSGKHSGESRQQEISEISRALKVLAKELNVPIIALSQLSRAVEQRPDHRPMLSDLRESGSIEQDADMVMFIYRDDYYHEDSDEKGVSEIIIAKQRAGSTGTVKLAWLPQYTKFANLEH